MASKTLKYNGYWSIRNNWGAKKACQNLRLGKIISSFFLWGGGGGAFVFKHSPLGALIDILTDTHISVWYQCIIRGLISQLAKSTLCDF